MRLTMETSAFIQTPFDKRQVEDGGEAEPELPLQDHQDDSSNNYVNSNNANPDDGGNRGNSGNNKIRGDRQGSGNNRTSRTGSGNNNREVGSGNGNGANIRVRLTKSYPDPRYGTLDDDDFLDRRSCRTMSGRCSAVHSQRVSARNSANRKYTISAPGVGICATLDEEELRFRLRQASLNDTQRNKEEPFKLEEEEEEEEEEVEEEEEELTEWDYDDLHSDLQSPDVELSSKVYKKACNQLGIVPVSFFCRHLQSRDLIMRQRLLGPKGARACSIALVLNTCVQKLDLTGNDIGNTGAHYLSQMLAENLYISSLILADNGLSSAGLKSLCRVLMNNTTVKKLDISGNHFKESDARHISELLKENTSLQELFLRHNDFREAGGEHIAAALLKNSTLVVLDLSWNHLRRKGAVSISDAMEKNDSLQVLRVAWNGWYMDGCKALGKALANNKTLLELDLCCNRINKDCLNILLTNLKNNSTLQHLNLDANPLTADGAKLLINTLNDAKNMAVNYIDISGQVVDQRVLASLEELQEKRVITVHHGVVFQHDDVAQEDDSLLDEDPMMVLMEFMRQRNMRLVDLFQSLDTDGSKSLTRDEFREGLLGVNIPMSARSFDKLMKKLDQDGDGEVDFHELMDGQKEYKRKLMRLQKKQALEPDEESEIQRIERKIKKILAAKMEAEKEKKAGADKLRGAAAAVMLAQGASNKLRALAGANTQGGQTQQQTEAKTGVVGQG